MVFRDVSLNIILFHFACVYIIYSIYIILYKRTYMNIIYHNWMYMWLPIEFGGAEFTLSYFEIL